MMKKHRPSASQAVKPSGPDTTASKRKDYLTVLAIWGALTGTWGALTGTAVAIRDTYKYFDEKRPQFHVRAQVDGVLMPGATKPVGHITVRVTNVGIATASLSPTLYVLTVNSRSGEKEQAQLTFAKPPSENEGHDVPGAPPTLKTGEDASAVSDTLFLPIAAQPLDYLSVRFELIGGGRYLATIDEPFFVTRDKQTGNIIGWGGGANAKALSLF
jgi:hypothetical protein